VLSFLKELGADERENWRRGIKEYLIHYLLHFLLSVGCAGMFV